MGQILHLDQASTSQLPCTNMAVGIVIQRLTREACAHMVLRKDKVEIGNSGLEVNRGIPYV